MIIGHNLDAMRALYFMNANQKKMSNAMLCLSSGKKLNSAADDPAGLIISQHMQAQINSLNVAEQNSKDGQSMMQTAEGGLSETQSILQRMNELATQAANDTNVSIDRSGIQNELNELEKEITHIALSTNFNGQNLLNSSGGLTLQIGATANSYDSMGLDLSKFDIGSYLGSITDGSIKVDNSDDSRSAMSVIQKAIDQVSSSRSTIGACENALDYNIDNLENESENLTSAMSNITDADMAKEMMQYAKYNVLEQTAQAMFAQANQEPNGVLKLLDSLNNNGK